MTADATLVDKEAVYDTYLSPLVSLLADLCQQYGIAMLANFTIPTMQDPTLQVMTTIPDWRGVHPLNHQEAVNALRRDSPKSVVR